MTKKSQLSLYKKWNEDKEYTSIGLFRELKKKFNIKKVFYPGSYVHITPSLVFSDVVYADSHKNTDKFFGDKEVLDFVEKKKEYPENSTIQFFQQDYNKSFKGLDSDFDLVISQYAGFVGQAVKKYLKKGGLLVCNNSHGDASMSAIDPDYELIAVYQRRSDEKFSISDKNLDTYLIPKKEIAPTRETITKSMKGVAYTKSPSGYIFKKTT